MRSTNLLDLEFSLLYSYIPFCSLEYIPYPILMTWRLYFAMPCNISTDMSNQNNRILRSTKFSNLYGRVGTNRTDYKPMYSFAMFKRVLWRTLANFLIQEWLCNVIPGRCTNNYRKEKAGQKNNRCYDSLRMLIPKTNKQTYNGWYHKEMTYQKWADWKYANDEDQ